MRHSRGSNFSFSRLKIHVFGHKIRNFMLPPRGSNFGVLRLKIRIYGQKGGPDFSYPRLKIHVFRHKLDSYAPFARTQFWRFTP